jgi:hypothetical protein
MFASVYLVLHMFKMIASVFQVCFASVSDAYFKCFICHQTYVASVVSGCMFQKYIGVACSSSPSAASSYYVLFPASTRHPYGAAVGS